MPKEITDFVQSRVLRRILAAKNESASRAGYTVKMYFREDLQREFDWVACNYDYKM